MRRALAVCLALLPAPLSAGAWTLPQGDGLVIVTLSHSRDDAFFDGAGGITSGSDFQKTELSAYAEYGLTDAVTLLGQTTLSAREVEGAAPDDRTGLDYTELGARARISQWDGYVFSLQASGRLPGASSPASPAEVGITDPELDIRALLGRGFSFGETTGYVDLQLGYRVRFDDPPNEIRFDATAGWRPRPDWLALAQLFTTISDGSAKGVFTNADTAKLQLSAAYDLSPAWTLQAGAFATVWTREAADESGVFASVWRRF